ncbi:SDR family NAD(P)-dependent oxidoreductase [Streptomyces sp. NPDC050549]
MALITGAGSGIGSAAAHRYAQRGASSALLDIDGDALRSLVAALGA